MPRTKSSKIDATDTSGANLGTALKTLQTAFNGLVAKHNAAMTKLDADAGVTDTNYASLQGGVATIATIDD